MDAGSDTAKIIKLGDFERNHKASKLQNGKLCWYGHIKIGEESYVGNRMMEMAVPGRRKRGRPRRRWMDLVREDLERVEAKEGDEIDWVKWERLLHCGDPK